MKNIKIIVNPASGQPEPILTYLNNAFKDTDIHWDVAITKKDEDAQNFARKAIKDKVDAVAVYGGDGSVMDVARVLCNTEIPLGIIPGGTANVMAKELEIPTDTAKAAELLAGKFKIIKVDMGMVNKIPFLIRINVGLAAEMVTEADRKLKDNLGQVAYGVTAVKQIQKSELVQYKMILDGKEIETEGITLIVANSGNLGFEGLSLVHSISPTDGWLDVVSVKNANLASIIEWFNSTLTKSSPSGAIEHWRAKEVNIHFKPKKSIIIDDREVQTNHLKAKILPKAIHIIVPKK